MLLSSASIHTSRAFTVYTPKLDHCQDQHTIGVVAVMPLTQVAINVHIMPMYKTRPTGEPVVSD